MVIMLCSLLSLTFKPCVKAPIVLLKDSVPHLFFMRSKKITKMNGRRQCKANVMITILLFVLTALRPVSVSGQAVSIKFKSEDKDKNRKPKMKARIRASQHCNLRSFTRLGSYLLVQRLAITRNKHGMIGANVHTQ